MIDLARYLQPGESVIMACRRGDLRIIHRAKRLPSGWRDVTSKVAELWNLEPDERGNLRAEDAVTLLDCIYANCPGLRSISIHDMEQIERIGK